MRTKGGRVFFLFVMMLSLIAVAADAGVTVEVYTGKSSFINRLGGAPMMNVVNFDDIDASGSMWVPFLSDRYRDTHGIIVTGQDGQYASTNFMSFDDFVPASRPNMYAPGPIDTDSESGHAGGNTTEIAFVSGGTAGLTAGFGLYFVDADYPKDGRCSLAVYDSDGNILGSFNQIKTADKGRLFVGLVALDTMTGQPVSAIARAIVVNGTGFLLQSPVN